MPKESFFYIVCPCNCTRALPVEYSPFATDIADFGNKIWQHLVHEKGLEGAIEYLHEKVDRRVSRRESKDEKGPGTA